MMARILGSVTALLVFLVLTTAANASYLTFRVTWSGESFGNPVKAHGFITIDPSAIGDSWDDIISIPDFALVPELKVTVEGSQYYDWTYTYFYFSGIYFWTPSPLDLTKELIGQPLANGCVFGPSTDDFCGSNSGDFNLFGSLNGVNYFTLGVPDENGDRLLVTSIRADMPEPECWLILIAGLCAVTTSPGLRRAPPKKWGSLCRPRGARRIGV